MPEVGKCACADEQSPRPEPHPRFQVRAADLALIGKKITVGLVITAIPLAVIGGGLALTRACLHPHHSVATPATRPIHPSPGR